MDLRHLRSFVTVTQELSFRTAAKRLGMSQPPLSRQIKALEEEVGARLLERDRNRRVSLTDAGQAFLSDAKRTLAAADATLRHAREAADGARGQLHVADIGVLASSVLPTLLEAFRARHPAVEVFLVELDRSAQAAAMREGRIHVGIYPDLVIPQDRQFQTRELLACPMVAVLPPGHPQSGAGPGHHALDFDALAGDTFLVPLDCATSGYQARLEHSCAAAGFHPRATHPVGGIPNLLGMIAAGYGVALLPEMLVRGQVAARQIRRLDASVPDFRLNLVWWRQSTSQVLQNFLAAVQEISCHGGGFGPPSCPAQATPDANPASSPNAALNTPPAFPGPLATPE